MIRDGAIHVIDADRRRAPCREAQEPNSGNKHYSLGQKSTNSG